MAPATASPTRPLGTFPLRGVVPSVPAGDGSAAVLLEMMLTHVREHLADPRLQVNGACDQSRAAPRRPPPSPRRCASRPRITPTASPCAPRTTRYR